MRVQNKYRKISVTEEVYQRLKKDRQQFQDTIGGGTWSISDTITEYLKIVGGK